MYIHKNVAGRRLLGVRFWDGHPPPVPASPLLQGRVASGGLSSTRGQTLAKKLTPRIVRTTGSCPWTLSISSQKEKNLEVNVLQISYMIVGFLVNSDAKRLLARAPG